MDNPQPPNPAALDYASPTARCSRVATTSMALGIMGAVTSLFVIGILPGLLAIVVGIVARDRIRRNMNSLGGERRANWGVGLGLLAIPLSIGTAVLMPCGCGAREPSNRSYCAANLRGIAQSMNVYAADNNDMFPVLPFAPYGAANAGPSSDTDGGHAAPASTAPGAVPSILALYKPAGPLHGSPNANLFLLVQLNYCAPKQFLCKSDPFVSDPASPTTPTGDTYLNFQKPNQLSYAFAYPYAPDGTPGNWWKNTTDSSLPLAADMPPKNGTGTPPKNVSPGKLPTDPHSWNSPNHNFEGQNVAFGDGHAEFTRRPDIGQSNDNLFTFTATNSTSDFAGTQPTPAPITILTTTSPYDIVLVPSRNLTTGGF